LEVFFERDKTLHEREQLGLRVFNVYVYSLMGKTGYMSVGLINYIGLGILLLTRVYRDSSRITRINKRSICVELLLRISVSPHLRYRLFDAITRYRPV